MRVLTICGSPRRNGNSFRLAEAAHAAAMAGGHEGELIHLDDHLSCFLRDCRECRLESGECGLDDGFADLFLKAFLPADGVLLATPLYWYGMSGQLKTFFDRTFCYYAASHPRSEAYAEAMCGKRYGLLIASEESYPGASLGVVHSVQEFCRYTRSAFVGVVRGIGNRRGDVLSDPCDPLAKARQLGSTLFDRHYSDYRMDTVRQASVPDNVAAAAKGPAVSGLGTDTATK